MKKELEQWKFWLAIISGIVSTMIYFFDLKSAVMVQSEQITEVRHDIEEIKQHLKEGDVVTSFDSKVLKRSIHAGAD